MAINLHYTQLQGLPVYPDVASLPRVPDLAVIATPPARVPGLVAELGAKLGAKGTRAAIVLSAGMNADHGGGRSHRQAMLGAGHLLQLARGFNFQIQRNSPSDTLGLTLDLQSSPLN